MTKLVGCRGKLKVTVLYPVASGSSIGVTEMLDDIWPAASVTASGMVV